MEYDFTFKVRDLGDSMKFNATLTLPKIACTGGGGSWTPANLAVAPMAWYDALTASTITQSGGTVSQWADKSGNARHITQATGASRPAYSATGFNGTLPGLSFDGTDDLLTAASAFAFSAQYPSLFAVHKGAATQDTNAGIIFMRGGINASGLKQRELSGEWGYQWDDAHYDDVTSIAINSSPHIFALTVNATTASVYQDGTAATFTDTFAALTGTVTTFDVGKDPDTAERYYEGTVGEILVLGYEPTSLERQKIEGYLAHRWGLAGSLPALHPYKVSAP